MRVLNHLCSFLLVARLISAVPTTANETPVVPQVDNSAAEMVLYEGDEGKLLGRSLASPP